jgi:hypothetical protein
VITLLSSHASASCANAGVAIPANAKVATDPNNSDLAVLLSKTEFLCDGSLVILLSLWSMFFG